jgi:creatinine amidohydrolase
MNRREIITTGLAGAVAGLTGADAVQAQSPAVQSGAAAAPATAAAAVPPGASGTSILADTMAEMTWYEAEAAAKSGASVLWSFGVVEEHGPHLPLGTDIYVPAALLRRVRMLLGKQGHPAVILPAYYWGINETTGGFPGSIEIRPSSMIELMTDVLASLKRKGYARVFCISGHGDALHNQTIFDGVKKARSESGVDAAALFNGPLARRLQIDPVDSALTIFETPPSGPPPKFSDIHAGNPETSAMLYLYPDLVRKDVVQSLAPTDFGQDDLAEWRKGPEAARRKTPLGYLGDPASAEADRGRANFEAQAEAMTTAILRRVAQKQ